MVHAGEVKGSFCGLFRHTFLLLLLSPLSLSLSPYKYHKIINSKTLRHFPSTSEISVPLPFSGHLSSRKPRFRSSDTSRISATFCAGENSPGSQLRQGFFALGGNLGFRRAGNNSFRNGKLGLNPTQELEICV